MAASQDHPADWRRTLLVSAALESGLLAAFAEPCTPARAAAAAGLDARASAIVARALVDVGCLEDAGGGALRLAGWGAVLIGGPGGEEFAGALALEARAMRSHLALAQTLRTGRPQDDVSAGDRTTRERFMRAMRQVAAPRAAATVEALGPPPPGGRLLDVGGAPGTYALAFAAAGWSVTVLDLPETLEIGAPDLRAGGVEVVAGDATQGLPGGPWDVVYIGNVLHLLGPGGRLALQEVLGDLSPQGPSFGVMMLVSTEEGDAYPRAAYEEWMAAAGCPLERAVSLEEGWHHLLLGAPAP
jgi:hypothetical protein